MTAAKTGAGEAPSDLPGRTFDPDALRARYREEREKRLRPDASDQYLEPAGELAHFANDPWVEPGYERGPLPGFVDKSAKIIYYFHNFHEERAHHV